MYNCNSKGMAKGAGASGRNQMAGTNKVMAIKALRGLTYLGLKESKEMIEKGKFSFTPISGLTEDEVDSLIRSLRGTGVEVVKASAGDSIPLSMLEDALGEAVFQKNYGLAEEILAVLKRNAI